MGAGEVKADEVRAGKVRAGEVRAGEVRAGGTRASKLRAGESLFQIIFFHTRLKKSLCVLVTLPTTDPQKTVKI